MRLSFLFLHMVSLLGLSLRKSISDTFPFLCAHSRVHAKMVSDLLSLLEFCLGEEHVFLHHGVVLGWGGRGKEGQSG